MNSKSRLNLQNESSKDRRLGASRINHTMVNNPFSQSKSIQKNLNFTGLPSKQQKSKDEVQSKYAFFRLEAQGAH
jgi:hypothetical protein